jgi:hypothetical protein
MMGNSPVPGLSKLPGVSSVTTIGNPASGQPTCAARATSGPKGQVAIARFVAQDRATRPTTTVALVGIVVGVPLGMVVGRVVWNTFATNLGALPVAAVPGLAIAVLVVANALAVIPAVTSARKRSVGQLLRRTE